MSGLFFEGYNFTTVLTLVAVISSIILITELSRRFKFLAIALYIVLPVVLGITVWKTTAVRGKGDWFPIIKTVSALAGVIGFMAIRYCKKIHNKKWPLAFPALILGINILEAIYREYQIFTNFNGANQTFDAAQGLTMHGGVWNIINGVAGILLILTMTGMLGIKVSKDKTKDMIWTDQLWFWIMAYNFWNLSYCYNAISERAAYAGLSLLVASSVMEFVFKKGAWLQHRATTLAIFAMFSVTFSNYAQNPAFQIKSTLKPEPMVALSIISLVINGAVFAFMLYKSVKAKKCPYTNDIYTDMKTYQKVLRKNKLA